MLRIGPLLTAPFYFVRHGTTDHNKARLIMGQADIPLNEEGREQARRVAQVCAHRLHDVTTILASPLSRALETAQIISQELGVGLRVIEDLKERGWGALQGQKHTSRFIQPLPNDIESVEEFDGRVISVLGTVIASPPIMIVAHSGTCRAFRRYFKTGDSEAPVYNARLMRFEPIEGHKWRERSLEKNTHAAGVNFSSATVVRAKL